MKIPDLKKMTGRGIPALSSLLVALAENNLRVGLHLRGSVFVASLKLHPAIVDDALHLIIMHRPAAFQCGKAGWLHEIPPLLAGARSAALAAILSGQAADTSAGGDDVAPTLT